MRNDEIEMIKRLVRHGSFYLTGSRYWNKLDPELIPLEPNTDCDFVAEYDDQTIRNLIDVGFTLKNGSVDSHDSPEYSPNDGGTALVMYYGQVQVIFKHGLDVYLAVQCAMSPAFYKKFIWKKYNTVENIRHLLYTLYTIEAANRTRLAELNMDFS